MLAMRKISINKGSLCIFYRDNQLLTYEYLSLRFIKNYAAVLPT